MKEAEKEALIQEGRNQVLYLLLYLIKSARFGAMLKKIAASFLALGYRGSGHGQQKNLRAEVFRLPFSQSPLRPIVPPSGAGFGTFKKDSKVAVRLIGPVP